MSKNLLKIKTGLTLLSVFLCFISGPAVAGEDWVFEPVLDTEIFYDGIKLHEISLPFKIGDRVFVKTYSLQTDTRVYGIYEITDGNVVPLFIADMDVPETDDPFSYIKAFDVQGEKVVFVGGGKKIASTGIFLFDGQTLTAVVGPTTKIPKRKINFKVLNDVFFSGDSIVFSGGKKSQEGVFRYKNGEVEMLIHEPVQHWTKKQRAKMTHLRVRSVDKILKMEGDVIAKVIKTRNGEPVTEHYKFTATGLKRFRLSPIDLVSYTGFAEVKGVQAYDSTLIFYGYDSAKLGGLYKLTSGDPELIADNTTRLWPEDSLFLEKVPGETMNVGDILNPAIEMEFKKSFEGIPFWRTTFSLFELEGMLPKHYIRSFLVGEEIFPIRPQRKSGELAGNIGRVIGAGIAAAIFGGGFIAPTVQNQTRLDVLRTQARLQGFSAQEVSWGNYFQTPLMAGTGGFSSNGEVVIFHAVNLKGQQGLFLFKDGMIENILNKGDLLPEGRVKHIYIAGDAFEGDSFMFWVELEEASGDLNQVLYTTKIPFAPGKTPPTPSSE
ncbi:MAG: hypothetical protein IIA70_06690 [Proteobacteria bacterium]|nr:hypothetical protein [Pseudomonadota bacterium]